MSREAWDRAWTAAQSLPGRGEKHVRVTRTKQTEFCATAYVLTPAGVTECAAAFGANDDAALDALVARCREKAA